MSPHSSNKKTPSLKASLHKAPKKRHAKAGVLHLCGDLDYGDPARETVTLAILTQRAGRKALIASSGGTLVTESERAAVKHSRMPLDRHGVFTNWRNRVHLEALIQREHPVLVHAHGADVVEMACRICIQHNLPLVVDLTQPLPNTSSTKHLIAHMAQTSCTVRVPTRMMEKHLTSTFAINPAIVTRVSPGIDLQSYNTAAISAERLHTMSKLWRLPEQAIIALMPMPMQPLLGHTVFLDALTHLKDENIYAILVGNDRHAPGLRDDLEKSVERLGLSGKVVMPESCPDWPAAFWLSNVVVAANIAERGQNMEILGAQALGRPVIVTDVGANEEMTQKGETAWVIEPDNPEALAQALREAAHMNTDQRVNLADNTRYFVEDNFPQANWFNGVTEIYEALLQGRQKSDDRMIKVA